MKSDALLFVGILTTTFTLVILKQLMGGVSAGGEICGNGDDWLTRIVENFLEFHEDGLPKPVYCKNFKPGSDGSDKRCGWLRGDKKVATSGKATFDVWYRDSVKYNKRAYLYHFALYQAPDNPSRYVYYASNDPELGSSSKPAFRPLEKFVSCNAVNERLDCSNGGKLWPNQYRSIGCILNRKRFNIIHQLLIYKRLCKLLYCLLFNSINSVRDFRVLITLG